MKALSLIFVCLALVLPPAYSHDARRPAARVQGTAGLFARVRFKKPIRSAHQKTEQRCAACKH